MEFTHFDTHGNAIMVDVTEKKITTRLARAEGCIKMNPQLIEMVKTGGIKKGDVLAVARVAGIMAVKQTAHAIPMCHPLAISQCTVDFTLEEEGIWASCEVKLEGKTGVEMEALHGVTIALLTIYDMCKGMGYDMEISQVHLAEKMGGRSGHYLPQKP